MQSKAHSVASLSGIPAFLKKVSQENSGSAKVHKIGMYDTPTENFTILKNVLAQ